MTKLVLSCLFASALLRADFDSERWQYRTPVEVKESAPVSTVVVDRSVYEHSSAHLRDLRVLRGASEEVPYQLQILSGSQEEGELRPAILNKAFVPGTGLQAVLDLNGHKQHNRLRLVTGRKNFKETVKIETSDDGRNWALARNDGLIFNISREDQNVSDLTVDYPVSNRRYLRITIPGWKDPADLEAAWLTDFKETAAVRDTLATLTPVVSEDRKAQTTSLTFDLGSNNLPYDRLQLSIAPGLFSRNVELSTSSDGKHWVFATTGLISRTAEAEHRLLSVGEQWSRYGKITIFNGDNLPLQVDQITLSDFRRIVKFSSTAPGPYWLYSGNPDAREPSYDFASVLPATASATVVMLGRPEPNGQYRAPTPPLSDQHPRFLNAVLIAAVLIMGFITWRFLQKLKTDPNL